MLRTEQTARPNFLSDSRSDILELLHCKLLFLYVEKILLNLNSKMKIVFEIVSPNKENFAITQTKLLLFACFSSFSE